MTKYKITIDSLLELIKQKKYSAECDLKYHSQDLENADKTTTKTIHKLFGEINAYTDLICLIESKKATPKLEKMIFCSIKYLCVDCPNYNKTCGGRK